MHRCTCQFAFILGVIMATTASAVAAPPPDGTITATGMAVVKHKPDILRMSIGLTGQGKTMQEALANLKKRVTDAEAKLLDLGANKDSIVRGDPQVPVVSDRQRQMEEMMRPAKRGLAASGLPRSRKKL